MKRPLLRTVLALSLAQLPAFAQDPPAPDESAPEAPEAAEPAEPEEKPLSESLAGTAKAEYEAGKLLYVDGDYAGARLKFERAYELSKDHRLLWNIAAAEKNQRRYARVIRALERYLAEGGDRLSAADRAEAEQLLNTVSAFVSKVEVVVNQPGATISIDGERLAQSPLSEPLLVDQGTRRLVVDKPGYEPYAAQLKFTGGQAKKVKVELERKSNEGRLRVVAGMGDVISVDGRVVGKGTWQGKLPSGAHTVSVTGRGKLPYQADVLVQSGQTSTTRVVLDREPVAERQDSFWGGPWPWVIGGAVVAAGAGVGAYFALRPEDEAAPPPVVGSLAPGTVELRFQR